MILFHICTDKIAVGKYKVVIFISYGINSDKADFGSNITIIWPQLEATLGQKNNRSIQKSQ